MKDPSKKDGLSIVEQRTDLPTEETLYALLQVISPGSTVLAVEPLPGSYSNFTHLVVARPASGSDFRIVVRRYKVFGSYDRGEKARREFKTFELLQQHGIPAPEPLYLDEQGAILGIPGIVTSYATGTQIESPDDPVRGEDYRIPGKGRIQVIHRKRQEESWLLKAAPKNSSNRR